MLILLSPAKTFIEPKNIFHHSYLYSTPEFLTETMELVTLIRQLSYKDLANLMKLSTKLTELNLHRFSIFQQDHQLVNSYPALFYYQGDAYQEIMVKNYTEQQLVFTNKTLKIISGLYGIINAFTLIQSYRLEMSVKLANKNGSNLYQFWDDKLTKSLNNLPNQVVINLASREYSKAINFTKLKHHVIDIVFQERNLGAYKIIGINAKKARGQLTNFILTKMITDHQQIKEFNLNNYRYIEDLSNDHRYVFIR